MALALISALGQIIPVSASKSAFVSSNPFVLIGGTLHTCPPIMKDADARKVFLSSQMYESLVRRHHKGKLVFTDNDPATLTHHNESCQTLVRATHIRLEKIVATER